jgi:hypothetical protein
MLSRMTTRSAALRSLALFWAALHLASPGLTSVAHGVGAAQGVQPAAHVESTTSETCPVVHAPDCGVCRYLSQASGVASTPSYALLRRAGNEPVPTLRTRAISAAVVLPDGRAPPVI